MSIEPREHPKEIYWATATPEDFQSVVIEDWIEGVGHVFTLYEVEFIRRFGKALETRANNKR